LTFVMPWITITWRDNTEFGDLENFMNKQLTFFIVDDDKNIIEVLRRFLETDGHAVFGCTSSVQALREIIEKKPDCVLLDMMMPELDGLELLKKLRNEPGLEKMKIVIVSGKTYEVDRQRAYAFGADGYFTKPINFKEIGKALRRIVEDRIEIRFWGIHGTMPVPGKHTVKYGGNTSCVSMEFPKGNFFIFDAGTGIKLLSNHLMAAKTPLSGTKLFISHPHWDHINALPFFVPLYVQGNEIEICGPAHGDVTMRDLISGQMDGVYFTVQIKEFSAMITFRDLKEEAIEIDGITVRTMLLNHPGNCLGYRVEFGNRVVCYVTDNELFPESSPYYNEYYSNQLAEFVKESDILITDCTYSDEDYKSKVGWGHSAVSQVVDLADRAGVKTLHLFHHDPDHTDADIDRLLVFAQTLLKKRNSKTLCVAPREQQGFKV